MKYPIIYNKYSPPQIVWSAVEEKVLDDQFKLFQRRYRRSNRIPRKVEKKGIAEPKKPLKPEKPKFLDNYGFEQSYGGGSSFNSKWEIFFLIFFLLVFWVFILITLALITIWWLFKQIFVFPYFIYLHLRRKSDYSKNYKCYLKELQEYSIQYEEYLKKIQKADTANLLHNEFLRNERSAYADYKHERKKHFEQVNEQAFQWKYDEALREMFVKVTEPIISDFEVQKGLTENYFLKICRRYFDFMSLKIISDCKLGYYYPDITIRTDFGLYIDVEIDEPYVSQTKEIIHYFEPEQNDYSDSIRNEHFKENGWVVIRFTEKQVIQQPYSCCYEISLLISKLNGKEIPPNKIQDRLEEEKLWSKKVAYEMISINYRKTYLPNNLSEFF